MPTPSSLRIDQRMEFASLHIIFIDHTEQKPNTVLFRNTFMAVILKKVQRLKANYGSLKNILQWL